MQILGMMSRAPASRVAGPWVGVIRGTGSLPWPPNVEGGEIERKRGIRGLIILA